MRLLTVGHGSLDRVALASLLAGAGVERVIDVRRFPGSRRNDDVRREALEQWLPETGIAYAWQPALGGRRHLRPDGRITAHVPAAGARPDGVGRLVWDGAGGADDAPGRTKAPTP
ncbi:DUF488 family protein [Georgenia faecalis]|uniref:DUF488 family protein n=1 Tax=Georgenia faecalis TaxID=2483799 RepID=A0ABV9D8J3_9MICO|nr:DUF488 domain-containing protein [Georgenia faecalis]